MCLVARTLEAAGIPTVIVGSALDIVSHCGAPRHVFTDFPLGNPCGKPYDVAMQRTIVSLALDMLETATAPGAFQQTPFEWGSNEWRQRYMEIRPQDVERLAAMGVARRSQRQALRDSGRVRAE